MVGHLVCVKVSIGQFAVNVGDRLSIHELLFPGDDIMRQKFRRRRPVNTADERHPTTHLVWQPGERPEMPGKQPGQLVVRDSRRQYIGHSFFLMHARVVFSCYYHLLILHFNNHQTLFFVIHTKNIKETIVIDGGVCLS